MRRWLIHLPDGLVVVAAAAEAGTAEAAIVVPTADPASLDKLQDHEQYVSKIVSD